jgi:uncharacterized protein YecT (DUF1311 family)
MDKLIAVIFTGMLAISNSVIAEECANKENTVAILDCHIAGYKAADKELNDVYSQAMKSLLGDKKKKLKEAQKAWLKYRDSSFAFIVEANKDAGTFGNVVIEDYKTTFVKKRVLELKYVLNSSEDSPVGW